MQIFNEKKSLDDLIFPVANTAKFKLKQRQY